MRFPFRHILYSVTPFRFLLSKDNRILIHISEFITLDYLCGGCRVSACNVSYAIS